MFSYYGSKERFIRYYPAPLYPRIREPFAGSAKYSLAYPDREVILTDEYKWVVWAWEYILSASTEDIASLIEPAPYQDFSIYARSEKEKALYAFITSFANHSTRRTASKYVDRVFRKHKALILEMLHKVKHWQITQGDYTTHPVDDECTWFIDPPYEFGGQHYPKHKIDYPALRKWAMNLKGQVIICENTKATWIDVHPIRTNWGLAGKSSIEGYWTNLDYHTTDNQLILDLKAA